MRAYEPKKQVSYKGLKIVDRGKRYADYLRESEYSESMKRYGLQAFKSNYYTSKKFK